MLIATAPGKLMLTGEYAVLDGAPAVMVAVDRRATARRNATPRGSSPFLLAVADEIAARRGVASGEAQAALEIAVDSTQFYDTLGSPRRLAETTLIRRSITAELAIDPVARAAAELAGSDRTKLGLGSSAAVTVAATALALGTADRHQVLEIAQAAHARAQGPRGARGSGADVAASVYGGVLVFTRPDADGPCQVEPRRWPIDVTLLPFFTGASADTAQLVAKVNAARALQRAAVESALIAIADASRAACSALSAPNDLAPVALIGALALAAAATDRLAAATGLALVPECVTVARAQLARLGGTAKTTGAGGGDVGVAVLPASVDPMLAARLLAEAGCRPLRMTLDDRGVEVHADSPDPQP
jgi:phosphomevalonate kinase